MSSYSSTPATHSAAPAYRSLTPEPIQDWWRRTDGGRIPWVTSTVTPRLPHLEIIVRSGWGEGATTGPYDPNTGESILPWNAHNELNPDGDYPSPGCSPTEFDKLRRCGMGEPLEDVPLWNLEDDAGWDQPEEEYGRLPQIFHGTDSESDSSEDSAELLVTQEAIDRGQRIVEEQQRAIEAMREVNRRARAILDRILSESE
ncbi:hypothetical protein FRC10_006271 [Ceratobasidium sp. 414]|nr:hypothetical protein FRC10_006271 [Ceratobasidium sp. 414]